MGNLDGKSSLPKNEKRQLVRKLFSIEKRSAQILVVFLLASLWFRSWPISLGLMAGGAVALLNFRWLWRIMERYFLEQKKHYAAQILLKFPALLAGLFLIIRYGKIDPPAFLVGLSTLVLGIFYETMLDPLRARRKRVL